MIDIGDREGGKEEKMRRGQQAIYKTRTHHMCGGNKGRCDEGNVQPPCHDDVEQVYGIDEL